MNLMIALLKLAGAVLSLAAGIIRVLSAANESKHEKDEDRSSTELTAPTKSNSGAALLPQRALPSTLFYPIRQNVNQRGLPFAGIVRVATNGLVCVYLGSFDSVVGPNISNHSSSKSHYVLAKHWMP